MLPALFLLSIPLAAQTPPTAQTPAAPAWKVVTDSRHACQVAVPPDWALYTEGSGAAVFHDASTAIAVVTSQPGQEFKPLPPTMLKLLDVPKDRMFENSAKRTFYQDRISQSAESPNAYTASVPGRAGGTCSCHIVALPDISAETAKKIAASLGPFTEPAQESRR